MEGVACLVDDMNTTDCSRCSFRGDRLGEGSGLRPTARSGNGGSGCCEEAVLEDKDVDVDDCNGDRDSLVKSGRVGIGFGADIW